MIGFRFHLVSLIAVFLSLALGIGMGATVIDKATVDSLRRRVAVSDEESERLRRLNSDLSKSSAVQGEYLNLLDEYVLANRLAGVKVAFIDAGVAEGARLGDLRASVEEAGAVYVGTLTLSERAILNDEKVLENLNKAFNTPGASAAQTRNVIWTRINQVQAGSLPSTSLDPVITSGVMTWSGSSDSESVQSIVGARVVLAGGAGPRREPVAFELAKALSERRNLPFVAIESAVVDNQNGNITRAVFVDLIRASQSLRQSISTVDNLEMASGLVATVLALDNAGRQTFGSFGVAPTAESPIPKRS